MRKSFNAGETLFRLGTSQLVYLTSDLVTSTRVTALLSDVSPLSAFSNASAKNNGGFRVHRTKMKQNQVKIALVRSPRIVDEFCGVSLGGRGVRGGGDGKGTRE